ncbi:MULTISPECIES: CheF family chemotaxis protein [Haloarcula]|uniref:CheF family chemotaxis protein n=1 Tax=Haloarcula TaxID=2237 RepID=UPI0023EDB98C|nr:CheF family chemotaxis protein [Halomicroarcula sp. XH51]
MSSVLADFTGTFAAETTDWDGPVEGRILLGKGQLVLAAGEDDTLRVPLDSVFDVSVGTTPNFFDPMPGKPVTVAYRERDKRLAVAVAAGEDAIEKFVTVLYKAMLNGADVTLKHPAKVGGRVTDAGFKGGLLTLQTGAVEFDTDEGPVTIPLDSVIDFNREERAVDGQRRPVLVVSHMDDGTALTTLAAVDSNRKLSLLGRYIRRVYQRVIDSLSQLSLSEAETEALATIYSTGDMDVSLANVLDTEPNQVKRLLHSLHEKGLIESKDGGPVLTARGQIVVTHYLERVNA